MPWREALAVAGLLTALLRPDLATAHAVLLRGTPAPGSTTPAGHVQIELQFNSRIEHQASQLQMQGPDGATQKLSLLDSPVDVLRAETDVAPGAYTLHWQVLAVDGHLTRGIIPFAVKDERPTTVSSTAP